MQSGAKLNYLHLEILSATRYLFVAWDNCVTRHYGEVMRKAMRTETYDCPTRSADGMKWNV